MALTLHQETNEVSDRTLEGCFDLCVKFGFECFFDGRASTEIEEVVDVQPNVNGRVVVKYFTSPDAI